MATEADIVTGIAMKRFWRLQEPLIKMCGVFMDATFHGHSNDTIGFVSDVDMGRYCRFVPLNFLLSLTAPHLLGVLVLVTGYKFIAGVFVTGNSCSRMLRMRSSLVVKASDCQCTSWNGPGFDLSIRRHSGI